MATQLVASLRPSCVGEVSIATPTQLNSTWSCRQVHIVNNCHRSVLNVVTQLTQFVGRDVIWRVLTSLPGDGILE